MLTARFDDEEDDDDIHLSLPLPLQFSHSPFSLKMIDMVILCIDLRE